MSPYQFGEAADENMAALAFELRSEIARIRNQHDAEIARLRAALEPFATEASVYDTIPGIIVTHDNFELWQRSNHRTKLSVGDLRYARAAFHASSERTRTEP